MAANKCYFCERRLSKDTIVCPRCGQNQNTNKNYLKLAGIVGGALLILFIVIPVSLKSIGTQKLTTSKATSSNSNILKSLFSKKSKLGENNPTVAMYKSLGYSDKDIEKLLSLPTGGEEEAIEAVSSFFGSSENSESSDGAVNAIASLFGSIGKSATEELSKDENPTITVYKSMGYSDEQIDELLKMEGIDSREELDEVTKQSQNLINSFFGSSEDSNKDKVFLYKKKKIKSMTTIDSWDKETNYKLGQAVVANNDIDWGIDSIELLGNKLGSEASTEGEYIKVNYFLKNVGKYSSYKPNIAQSYMVPQLDGEGFATIYPLKDGYKYLSPGDNSPGQTILNPGVGATYSVIFNKNSNNDYIKLKLDYSSITFQY